ncbi:MAG: flagellar basal body P-ring formation chaperone FlgA [Candidatus Binatia bacterium]
MGQSRIFFLVFLMVLSLVFPLSAKTDGARQSLSQERVVETLREYVLERSAWRPDQVEIVLRSFTPSTLPDGAIDLVVLKPTRGVTPGLRRFLVAVQVNGREEARLWIDSEVQVFENVVVTSQPLAHYESVTPARVRLERRNLGDLPLQPLTSIDALAGQQASRPIEVNQVVTASMVELPRVVRRGSVVTLIYESSGIHVETSGRATEPGRVGDRIRVENPSSGKVVEGQILDDRRVRVN